MNKPWTEGKRIAVVNNVDSWRQCTDICRQTKGCKFWNYRSFGPETFTCGLLSEVSASGVKEGVSSGTVVHGLPGMFAQSARHILRISMGHENKTNSLFAWMFIFQLGLKIVHE